MRMRFRGMAVGPAVLRLAGSRPGVVCLAVICLATVCALAVRPLAGPAAGRAPGQGETPRPSPRQPHATIEPTLPVALEARLVSVSAAARGGTARLEISI